MAVVRAPLGRRPPLDADEVREMFLDRLGIRLEPEMCRYVLARLAETAPAAGDAGTPIPVIGGDARTGVALRRMVPLELLTAVQP